MTKVESAYGMSAFLSPADQGFTCVLKQRYDDFIVHEIGLDSHVAVLNDLGKNLAPKQQPLPKPSASALVPQDSHIPQVVWDQLRKLDESEGDVLGEVDINCENLTKEQRTKIHKCIREHFNNLDSITVCSGQTSEQADNVIKVRQASANSRKRKHWPQERGDFCKFVLFKENKDSSSALALVQKFLRIRNVSVAGTKDRRAVTSQYATVYRLEAEKLAALNDRLIGIKLGNFGYCDKELKLGDLKGNRFTVILRNVSELNEEMLKFYIERLKSTGFINYYGAQRFGTSSIATHLIGKAIIQNKWSHAVDLILSERDEKSPFYDCFNCWTSSKDASLALNAIPASKRDTSIEGMLLKTLKKSKSKDFAAAIRSLPRNVRNLYVHSFQSLLWNKLASKRIEKFGCKVLVGDYFGENEEELRGNAPLLVTSDNVDDVEIHRIVLPFFACKELVPRNEIAQWYDDLLAEEQVTWEQLKKCAKEYALHGGYRRLIVKIDSDKFAYDLIRYDDPLAQLNLTDLDIINGRIIDSPSNGSRIALKLEFDLPSSCYATMALRELTKCDFDKRSQILISSSAQERTIDDIDDNVEETLIAE